MKLKGRKTITTGRKIKDEHKTVKKTQRGKWCYKLMKRVEGKGKPLEKGVPGGLR